MDRPDRRTFLRAGAGAFGLTAVGSGAASQTTADYDEPPDPPNGASNDLDGESRKQLLVSVGAFAGAWATLLWALGRTDEDS